MQKTIGFEEVEHGGDLDAVVSDLIKSGAQVVRRKPDYDAEAAAVTVEIQDLAAFLKAFKATESYEFSTLYQPEDEPAVGREPARPDSMVDAVSSDLWEELDRIGGVLDKIEADDSLTEAEKDAAALKAAGSHTSNELEYHTYDACVGRLQRCGR